MQPDIITPNQPPTQNTNSNTPPVPPSPHASGVPTPPSQSPEQSQPPIQTFQNSTPPQKNSGKKKKVAIIVGIIVLIIAIAIGIYYFIYLPNTPENILKKSIRNTLMQDRISGKGTVSYKEPNSSMEYSLGYALKADRTRNAVDLQAQLNFGNSNIPAEVRSIDNSFYLKFDDLSAVTALASGLLGNDFGKTVDKIGQSVEGKWIEFDSSTAKSLGADKCSSVLTSKISDKDINQILSIYDKNPFIEIKSTSTDTVDGQKVTKAELGTNQDKVKAFGTSAEQLDIFKSLGACGGGDSSKTDTKGADEIENSTLTVWLDKSKKQIIKIAIAGKDKESESKLDFTFNKDNVDIQKPEGAIPAKQIIDQVMPLLGGFGFGANSKLPTESSSPSSALMQSQLN